MKLFLIISVSTAVWLLVTFVTEPTETARLVEFYKKVRPGVAGWRPVAALANDCDEGSAFRGSLTQWLAGCLFVTGLTISAGKLILGDHLAGFLWVLIALASGGTLIRQLQKTGWRMPE